jgi:hypothetical protein
MFSGRKDEELTDETGACMREEDEEEEVEVVVEGGSAAAAEASVETRTVLPSLEWG